MHFWMHVSEFHNEINEAGPDITKIGLRPNVIFRFLKAWYLSYLRIFNRYFLFMFNILYVNVISTGFYLWIASSWAFGMKFDGENNMIPFFYYTYLYVLMNVVMKHFREYWQFTSIIKSAWTSSVPSISFWNNWFKL